MKGLLPPVVALLAAALTTACTSPPRPRPHAASPERPPATLAANAPRPDPDWRITRRGRLRDMEGFTGRTDVLPGASFRLFVSTTSATFTVRAFRMGWYSGDLAALVWTSAPVRGGLQPDARIEQPGSMAVAPWRPSLTVQTGGWPAGSYLLRLDGSGGIQAYVPMVIRSPSVAGKLVLISAVTSYQAYNGWGQYSLYGGPGGSFANRGRRVTFDRPMSYNNGAGAYFSLEFPLVVLAEKLGLQPAYVTSTDLDLYPAILDGARAVVSEAHDEYWSPAMRDALTRARDSGTNIAFFGANAIFRKIRFESSPLGPDRVEVNYKDPVQDPLYGKDNAAVTGNWPDYPDADPESSLIGESYVCSVTSNYPMIVTDPTAWIWRGAGVHAGEALPGLVGPEFDQVNPEEPVPQPMEIVARSPVNCGAPATYSDVSYYTTSSGAGVFDAGTEDWICALPYVPAADSCGPASLHAAYVERAVESATANVLEVFAAGRAAQGHRARRLIPGSDGRQPLLGSE